MTRWLRAHRRLLASPTPRFSPSCFSNRTGCYFDQKLYFVPELRRRKSAPRMPITFDTLQERRSLPRLERRSRGRSREGGAANTQNERHGNGGELLEKDSSLLTLPTILTLARVAAIPFLLIVFYLNQWWARMAAAGIFIFAAITDWLDGYLARKMGTHSLFGAFLDPVADKLMVATTLVLLSTKPLHVSWAASLPWLIPLPSVAVIGREIAMSAVREWAANQGGDLVAAVAVNKLGKWKTATQMVALTILLVVGNDCVSGLDCALIGVGVSLLYISAGLALWSLAVYMKGIWGALMK